MPYDPLTGHNTDYSGQSLIGSVEASRFGDPEARWAPGGGPAATEHPAGSQVSRAAIIGTLGAAAFVTGPKVLPWLTNDLSQKIREKSANFTGSSFEEAPLFIQKIAQVLTPKTPLGSGSSLGDFWYRYARRVENTSFGGHYLSDLFGVFARAAYISETLSPWADREGKTFFFDYATLKPNAHLNTRKYLESMGVPEDVLNSARYFGWKNIIRQNLG